MGQSTPVVYGGRIFVTSVEGPRKEKLNLFALDLQTGRILWKRQMTSSRPHPTGDRVSRAAPTPAVEAERVFVLFDSGDLFAFRHDGEQLWHVDFNQRYGEMEGGHDFGSSLRQAGDRLFAHVSQAKPGYLVAIRKQNGAADWKMEMPVEGGYGTPLTARVDGDDLLLVSTQGGVAAHDPETGKLVWKNVLEGARGGGIPSLTLAGNMVVVSSAEKGRSFAVRLDEPGEKAWTARGAATQYSSPLIHEGRAYFVNAVGVLFAVEVATGKELWTMRLPGPCWASAIGARDQLYFFTTEGSTVVLRPGDQPEKLAENELPVAGTVYAAAVGGKAILIRTGTELWKVEEVGAVRSYAAPTVDNQLEAGATLAPAKFPQGSKTGDVWTNARDGQQYVRLPGGEFTMGCEPGKCAPDEAPARSGIEVAPLWMGKTEVTVDAYRRFSNASRTRMPEEARLLDRPLNPGWRKTHLPIVNMTWHQAQAFCQWTGGRLPTEAEWEFAARAGGSNMPEAWTAENSGTKPFDTQPFRQRRGIEEKLYENGAQLHQVGTKPANTFGLQDMLGNVTEWTDGFFNDYPPEIRGGPPSPPETPFRVTRGGSFLTPASRSRAISRQRHTLDGRMEATGFRCVAP